jgi:hypothetical protein
MTDFCIENPEASVGGATPDPLRIKTRATDPTKCKHGPNLPTHTFGMHTTLTLPYGLSFNARGEYMGGHDAREPAGGPRLDLRSPRWAAAKSQYVRDERVGARQLRRERTGWVDRLFHSRRWQ